MKPSAARRSLLSIFLGRRFGLRWAIGMALLLGWYASASGAVDVPPVERPRLFVLTDIGGDPDDTQSMIRLMLYANEFEIEGFVASASGTPGELKEAVTRPDLIRQVIQAYAAVQPNLALHHSAYPSAGELLNRVKSGNPNRGRGAVGEGQDTEGSAWIIQSIDRKDTRVLNVSIWGGQTDLAQALWRIREDRGPAGLAQAKARLRIFDIADQDGLAPWIHDEFPGLFYVLSKAADGVDRREAAFRGMYLDGDLTPTSREWLETNVLTGHGPLGALYPTRTWTAPNPNGALKEGDTPSWFYFLENGLNMPGRPGAGGWGGRYDPDADGVYRDAPDTIDGVAHVRLTVSRWRPAFQSELQARMDWCVKPPGEANHPPRAQVNNSAGPTPLAVTVDPGSTLSLDASASSDPDGDDLGFRWWIYREAGTIAAPVDLEGATSSRLTLRLRAGVPAGELHVVLEMRDSGEPPLTSYRRVVVEVRDTGAGPAAPAPAVWPEADWQQREPRDLGLDATLLRRARDYALTGQGSGMIVRHGFQVLTWGNLEQRYDLKSTTKSFGSIALGLALKDHRVGLDDRAVDRHPEFGVPPESNRDSGWLDRITLRNLATQTAGFEKPGGYTPLLFAPGTAWDYSDSGPNWLAECLTLAYRRDLNELMFERVFTPLGIGPDDLTWRANSYRPHSIEGIARREFGAGISANVDALARIGLLMLREGRWRDEPILDPAYVRLATQTENWVAALPVRDPKNYGHAAKHYGLLWWNNNDDTLEDVPPDTYWSWGLYDSLIVVFPSLDMVVARAGRSWTREPGADHYAVLEPFLGPIAQAAGRERDVAAIVRSRPVDDRAARQATDFAPVALSAKEEDRRQPRIPASRGEPRSPLIQEIRWAPADSVVRMGQGSDNWPIAWGDDDRLYGAYGDGWGFGPQHGRKLSLGFAVIEGDPPNPRGANLPAAEVERIGDGRSGPKASGLLMVDGVLYLLARNVTNAQLAWSEDRGAHWSWADWKFTNSFGCPTFLNFGPNYQGARDEFAYVYSPDVDTAYQRADQMVLARVPKHRIREQAAYRFFAGAQADGEPRWTPDIEARRPVFSNPGRCYRSGVTYIAGLKRYLWCQTGLGEDPRFGGGLAIYDAPEPWGPWTEVFAMDTWDIGPGESSSFPTKWMSRDGRRLNLVFSGEDAFSVRAAELVLRDAPSREP